MEAPLNHPMQDPLVIHGQNGKSIGQHVEDRHLVMKLGHLEPAALSGEVLIVSVLFADLRGFTAVAEQWTPRHAARFLNAYLTAMVDVIRGRLGMVQDFVGDGIMAVFGAPSPDPDHAWHAAVSALEMQSALECLERLQMAGPIRLGMGVSIHSGEVFAGTVGSPEQSKYAAVGDTVNTGSRLEELNRALGTSILMSGETIALLGNQVKANGLGWFPLRGKNNLIEVFELLALRRCANELSFRAPCPHPGKGLTCRSNGATG